VTKVVAASPDIVLAESSAVQNRSIAKCIAPMIPNPPVVAFGLLDDESEIIHCIEAGAAGFVSRDATFDQLFEVIDCVARGEFRCSARETALLLKRVSTSATWGSQGSSVTGLSDREVQVLGLVDQGLSNKEIARQLSIEVSTVKNHVHNILSKVGVGARGQAAARLRNAPMPVLRGER
jgi:DNA-binding NarL/FixJ family response regulator